MGECVQSVKWYDEFQSTYSQIPDFITMKSGKQFVKTSNASMSIIYSKENSVQ